MSGLGKFQGEPWWVEVLWSFVMDGGCDREVWDGDVCVSCFLVNDNLADVINDTNHPTTKAEQNVTVADLKWPWAATVPDVYMCLWERDDGFVCHTLHTSAALDAIEGAQ